MDFEGDICVCFEVELVADISDEREDQSAEDLTEERITQINRHTLFILEVLSE